MVIHARGMSQKSPLSPTSRTTIRRGSKRGITDRDVLLDILADGMVAHVGVATSTHPSVLPMAYGVDQEGPDRDGTLYLHGSVANRMLTEAFASPVCVTVTHLDGLVAARSGFHHSMNYRSAVVIGLPRLVTSDSERARSLDLLVDQMIPGRSASLRPPTRRELAATMVLAVPLHEASVKARAGGPVDEPDDAATGMWAGHVPVRLGAHAPVTDEFSTEPVPTDVEDRARQLGHDSAPE